VTLFLPPADGLGRVKREAPGKDGEAAEEGAFLLGEEVVAPGDGVAEGLLAGRQIALPAGQERQPPFQAGEERDRRQHPGPRRR
jgi:hypothetical protein